MYLCPKEVVVSASSKAPERGNITIGNSDVTAIGIDSKIHQVAIHKVQANTAFACLLNPSGWKKYRMVKKNNGPNHKPMRFVLFVLNFNFKNPIGKTFFFIYLIRIYPKMLFNFHVLLDL